MFQPVFVFDSRYPEVNPEIVARARELGFRMVDIRETGSSVHGGNPAVVVYNENGSMCDRVPDGARRFDQPKNTGWMVMMSATKGAVYALPNKLEFVEWFFGKQARWSRWSTGGFRI
jgi:hypothetical protein